MSEKNGPQKSLQQEFAPKSICYGCGPANPEGFHLESFVEGDRVVACWTPQKKHQAFPNVLNGGVIGTLLDCHCNCAAGWFLMQAKDLDKPPCTVTSEYKIQLLRPTPIDRELILIAKCDAIEGNKATMRGELRVGEKIYDTCQGIFVAVSEKHPALHLQDDSG